MAQALVFAIGAVTRIFLFAAHFTVRCGRRDYLPLAVVAGVRGKRYYLALAVVAGGGLVGGITWRLRRARAWFGQRFYLPLVVVANVVLSDQSDLSDLSDRAAAHANCVGGISLSPPVSGNA